MELLIDYGILFQNITPLFQSVDQNISGLTKVRYRKNLMSATVAKKGDLNI